MSELQTAIFNPKSKAAIVASAARTEDGRGSIFQQLWKIMVELKGEMNAVTWDGAREAMMRAKECLPSSGSYGGETMSLPGDQAGILCGLQAAVNFMYSYQPMKINTVVCKTPEGEPYISQVSLRIGDKRCPGALRD